MVRVADQRLLRMREQGLPVADHQLAKPRAGGSNRTESRDFKHGSGAGEQHDGSRGRDAVDQRGAADDDAVAAEHRNLDRSAMREVDMSQRGTRFTQDRLPDHLDRRERRTQQIEIQRVEQIAAADWADGRSWSYSQSGFDGQSAAARRSVARREYYCELVMPLIFPLQGRQAAAFAAEIRMAR